MTSQRPAVRKPAEGRSIAVVGEPVPQGATTAPLPTKEEIEKLLAVAPRYGVEIRLPKH